MEELLAEARPMADYYIEQIIGARGTLEEDRDKLREAVSFIRRIEDAVERNLFIKKVSEQLNVDQEVFKSEIHRTLSPGAAAPAGRQRIRKAGDPDPLELSLIHMMLEYPEQIPKVADSGVLGCFSTADLKELGERLIGFSTTGRGADISAFVEGLSEGPLRERILDLLMRENPYSEQWIGRIFADTTRQIQRKWYKERHSLLRRQIVRAEADGNRELCAGLLREKERLLQEEKRLA